MLAFHSIYLKLGVTIFAFYILFLRSFYRGRVLNGIKLINDIRIESLLLSEFIYPLVEEAPINCVAHALLVVISIFEVVWTDTLHSSEFFHCVVGILEFILVLNIIFVLSLITGDLMWIMMMIVVSLFAVTDVVLIRIDVIHVIKIVL